MDNIGHFAIGLVALILGVFLTVWLMWRTIKQAEDPGRVAYKWVITGIVFVTLVWMAGTTRGVSAVALPVIGAVFGIVIGILWAPHLGAIIAKPLTSFYDGGSSEVEARPFYSIARAKQKRGLYEEAIKAIREQLEKFPDDFEGWIFMAEIYARDLKDNAAAQNCIDEILSHSNHAPKNISFALNYSADWHLNLAGDRESAQASLERIILMHPDTEFAHNAAQRLAHMATPQMISDQKERPRIALPRHDEYIGLAGKVADPRRPEEHPAEIAARLVAQLEQHPEDVEAREKLAVVYAEHYQRLDMAAAEIEQLIASPGASQKEVARWLNLLADFYVRVSERMGAEQALRRIVSGFPGSAAAAKAETRVAYLDIEIRGKTKGQALKLGSYEENIGLKGQVPKTPA